MSPSRAFSCAVRGLLSALFALPLLHAQIEPQIKTTTDLLDVYIADAGKPQLVSVLDFTTGSRAVFEPGRYLTAPTRDGWLGGKQSFGDPIGLGGSVTPGKDYGFIFLLKTTTKKGDPAEVYLYRWPNTQTLYPSDAAPVKGIPYNFKGSYSGTVVNWTEVAATTIADITHVQFTVGGRTIDLPCPSRLFDSPYPFTSKEAFTVDYRQPVNVTRHATSDEITYDVWSDQHPTLTDEDAGIQETLDKTVPAGYVAIGNFYYSYDYFSWIFGSKYVRNATSTNIVAAPTSGLFSPASGYAVPATNETVTYPTKIDEVTEWDPVKKEWVKKKVFLTATGPAVGWLNGLPVMTRYQSQKVAGINVYLNYTTSIRWLYRYVDPYVDNKENSEEGGVAPALIPLNPTQAALWDDASRPKRKFVRELLQTNLATNQTAFQKFGPSGWVKTSAPYQAMDLYDFGGRSNVDPRTPQPWAYALANTYYRATVEGSPMFTTGTNSACPGKTFVLIFPTLGLTDAKIPSTTYVAQDAASAYVTYTEHGNKDLMKGSYTNLPSILNLKPGLETFHPGALSCTAAFGDGSSNAGPWGAAWEPNPSTTRSAKNPGLQTMVISLGIPGSYKLKAGNNARNPEEAYFRVAQWADPSRTDLGYGGWTPANAGVDDLSVIDGGKVAYYYSTDPAQLEKSLGDVAEKIVAGSASLSAPATPSTGARTTTQAYFGVFKTSRTPVWSGNLYSVGIKRVIDATTGREVFSFYGANGESTVRTIDLVDADGNIVLIKGLNDFDDHHLWSAFDLFGNYVTTEIPYGVTARPANAIDGAMLWSNRNIYTLLSGSNVLSDFKDNNASLITQLVTQFTTAGLFPASVTTALQKSDYVKAFINFYRGKHASDGSYNRIGIFGDIINSAPLAIELAEENLTGTGLTWPTTGSDKHVRLILVGTNLGMLHGFGEEAWYNGDKGHVEAKAKELWAFVPPDMLNTMFEVYVNRDVEDTFDHRYMVDGDPSLFFEDKPASNAVIGDTRVGPSEDAIVVFGMRKGGRSYYALSLSKFNGGRPHLPTLAWSLDPQTSTENVVKTMGMSTSVPIFTAISDNGAITGKKNVVFLTGGYANEEVNKNYRTKGLITNDQGMGRSVLALDVRGDESKPVIVKSWDWTSDATVGSIPAGVTPVAVYSNSELIQRVYFADMKGNVMALNGDPAKTEIKTGDKPTATGFRVDTSDYTKWLTSPRYLYKNSAFRFTTRPDAFRLSGDYPVAVDINGDSKPDIKPVTVMVSIGSGDWNNPTDHPEVASTPSATNRLYVFADRQDSGRLTYDSTGIPETQLQEIDDNTAGNAVWPSVYVKADGSSDPRITPGKPEYLFNVKTGYYFQLLANGTLPSAVDGTTRDKVIVSPLAKQGTLFFSIFGINGNTGFGCSANSFTRTFRECDILRPLSIPTQVKATSTVGDISDLTKGKNDCTGLAFYFNSLSSQLADAGDRVVQGGAVSAKEASFNQQTGANTPDIKFVKDTSSRRGFFLRSWRVVR